MKHYNFPNLQNLWNLLVQSALHKVSHYLIVKYLTSCYRQKTDKHVGEPKNVLLMRKKKKKKNKKASLLDPNYYLLQTSFANMTFKNEMARNSSLSYCCPLPWCQCSPLGHSSGCSVDSFILPWEKRRITSFHPLRTLMLMKRALFHVCFRPI